MGGKITGFSVSVYTLFQGTMRMIPKYVVYLQSKAKPSVNRKPKTYPTDKEPSNDLVVGELAVALEEQETFVLPEDMDYASVVEGILQITPDIEEEIAAVERGETVSMDEFKTMFAKWLD